MGRLGDAVGRALDAVRAASLRDVAVRHHDRGNGGLPEAVHRHGFEVAPGAVLVAGARPPARGGPPAPPGPPPGRRCAAPPPWGGGGGNPSPPLAPGGRS